MVFIGYKPTTGIWWWSGWWFGTWILFFHILGKKDPNWRTHIFQTGTTTNQWCVYRYNTILRNPEMVDMVCSGFTNYHSILHRFEKRDGKNMKNPSKWDYSLSYPKQGFKLLNLLGCCGHILHQISNKTSRASLIMDWSFDMMWCGKPPYTIPKIIIKWVETIPLVRCTLWLCQNSYWTWPIYGWFTH